MPKKRQAPFFSAMDNQTKKPGMNVFPSEPDSNRYIVAG